MIAQATPVAVLIPWAEPAANGIEANWKTSWPTPKPPFLHPKQIEKLSGLIGGNAVLYVIGHGAAGSTVIYPKTSLSPVTSKAEVSGTPLEAKALAEMLNGGLPPGFCGTIDLIICEGGMKAGDKPSFAEELAKHLKVGGSLFAYTDVLRIGWQTKGDRKVIEVGALETSDANQNRGQDAGTTSRRRFN
jgi:hypothetical protein